MSMPLEGDGRCGYLMPFFYDRGGGLVVRCEVEVFEL